ncbi:GAF domain-containing sensor histidine kinase [Thalassotalea atypica]|uniref:GAF domain-containing sensor histidine kinase n=1 Tax=Thalassotalea atypica TaxID=2054316 RepID=UPI002572EF86|nr:GAF domain-containing sensor histidine kinase [Thalassotalea atypica]
MHLAVNQTSRWQLASKIEEGRIHVLRMVAQHEPIDAIMNALCIKSQIYNRDMLCSILRLDNEHKTLHPIASVDLPTFYCEALEGVHIGAGVGSCGTSAFTKERVIVEDINTHPYWNQFKELALSAKLQACWSEPIIGVDGIVLGTFAMYYREPRIPTEEDLKFIELSANLAAVVFENHSNRQRLLEANNQLNQTINEQNNELKTVNDALSTAIKEQRKQHSLAIETEKMLTTNSLVSGFSHEISTPVGISLTAISAAEDKLSSLSDAFSQGKLTRKGFTLQIDELKKVIDINKQNLLKTNDLLQRFKDVNTSAIVSDVLTFSMVKFLGQLKSALKNVLGRHELAIQCEVFDITCNKESLWRVFFNLIENSIVHGFKHIDKGTIHINVTCESDHVIINYQDNGCGLLDQQTKDIFEPFYTSARNENSLGLGLSITHNFVNHNLHGHIRLIDSPVGVRYEITLPVSKSEASKA